MVNSDKMEVTPEHEGIAKDIASPIILRTLRHFTSQDIAQAVKNDQDIVKSLKEKRSALARLRLILTPIPFVDRVAPYMKSETWIRWFINNEMRHSRPDLYVQLIYDPEAFKWLHKNMVKLSEFLFE